MYINIMHNICDWYLSLFTQYNSMLNSEDMLYTLHILAIGLRAPPPQIIIFITCDKQNCYTFVYPIVSCLPDTCTIHE